MNKVCLSHYGKRCNSCVDDDCIVDEAAKDPPVLPIADGLSFDTTDAPAEHLVDTAQDFLVVVPDLESDDDDDNVHNALPVNVLREANGMPTMGYDDNQMLSLLNSIAERRVYFKAAKRGSEPSVKAKWELVAKDFFSAWTKLKPLKGPGLRKNYTAFAAAFVNYAHDDRSNHSAIQTEPTEWQKTLLKLEERCGSLKKLSDEAKAKKKSMAAAMIQREKEILGMKPRRLSLESNEDDDKASSSTPSDDIDKTLSKKTPRARSSSVDVYDLTDSLRDFDTTSEKIIALKEEELRVLSKVKDEENQIKKMEAEARIMEAKNRGEELALKRAMEEQLREESIMRRRLDARLVDVLSKLSDKI